MRAFFEAAGGRKLELDEGERGIREGAANLFRGYESVGGWLWLTDRRLVFRSHAIAVQSGESAWALDQITSAVPAMTMWIIPNGLRCTLRDGTILKLVVMGRAEWARAIEQARARSAFE